jgi:peptidyl-prolyl cis-trans isomerase SurA
VINELIDDRIKIGRAKDYGLIISSEDIDTAFQGMATRQHITPQQFIQALEHSGIRPSAVKDRIRAEMTWGQLVRGKFPSSLVVGQGEIASAIKTGNNEAANPTVAYLYTLYPIIVVVPPGSPEAVLKLKRQEAENLRGRFLDCKQGIILARALRDVAVREPVSRSSSNLPAELRDMLGKMELGHLTPPEVTAQGLQMFAVCDKKKSSADSPADRVAHDKIFNERFETESKRFLDELRKQAMIEYK